MKLRVRYVSEAGVYQADHSGVTNDENTTIYYNGVHLVDIHDHGNGIHIEGDRISIDLDYGQVGDLYHALRAHHDCCRKLHGVGIWEKTSVPLFTRIVSRKKKHSKKKRKGKKK